MIITAEPSIKRRPGRPRAVKQEEVSPQELKATGRPISLGAWAINVEDRKQLLHVLRSPVLVEAIRTLRAAYESEVPPFMASNAGGIVPSAADLNNLIALRAVHRAGFFGAFNALESLTDEKVLRKAQGNPWGDFRQETENAPSNNRK